MNTPGHGQNHPFVPYYSQALAPAKPSRGALGVFLFLAGLWNACAVFMYGALAGLLGKSGFTAHTSIGAMSLRRMALFGAVLAALKVVLVMGMWSWKRTAAMAYVVAGALSVLVTLKSHTPPFYEIIALVSVTLLIASRWSHFE